MALYKETTADLERRVMKMEFELENAMKFDRFIGKGSRAQKLFAECNVLWKRIYHNRTGGKKVL